MEKFNRNNTLTAVQIIKILDPYESGTIDLDDFDTLLAGFSPQIFAILSELFRKFISKYKSFLMPISYLLLNFSEPFESFSTIESSRKKQFFCESFDSLANSTQKSIRKGRNGSQGLTYAEIHQRKRTIENKIFQDCNNLYAKIEKKKERPIVKRSWKKENSIETSDYCKLIEVRKRHLRQSSAL